MSWGETEGYIEDTTRSGKGKRRGALRQAKRPFNVRMNFSYAQYVAFRNWYKNEDKKGLLSFGFPNLDRVGHDTTDIKEYQFAKGGSPKYSNPSAKIIQCTMTWEEV